MVATLSLGIVPHSKWTKIVIRSEPVVVVDKLATGPAVVVGDLARDRTPLFDGLLACVGAATHGVIDRPVKKSFVEIVCPYSVPWIVLAPNERSARSGVFIQVYSGGLVNGPHQVSL